MTDKCNETFFNLDPKKLIDHWFECYDDFSKIYVTQESPEEWYGKNTFNSISLMDAVIEVCGNEFSKKKLAKGAVELGRLKQKESTLRAASGVSMLDLRPNLMKPFAYTFLGTMGGSIASWIINPLFTLQMGLLSTAFCWGSVPWDHYSTKYAQSRVGGWEQSSSSRDEYGNFKSSLKHELKLGAALSVTSMLSPYSGLLMGGLKYAAGLSNFALPYSSRKSAGKSHKYDYTFIHSSHDQSNPK